MEEIRQAEVYGVRPKRTFREAATKYLNESTKASLQRDAHLLRILEPFIGDVSLDAVHMGTLEPYIKDRKKYGWKKRTINYGLQVVRHIINLATYEWIDAYGLTWLAHAPRIKLFKEDDKKQPYPLDWREQEALFAELPEYLRRMALFAVNTGCRDQEICNLKWTWEIAIPELRTSVFIIPDYGDRKKFKPKNREDRLVVLNSITEAVIEQLRGNHGEFVFTYEGSQVQRMYNRAWRKARENAGLPHVTVHDLRHTFGRRLRSAGVSFEDRQDLLGHKSGRITTHYCKPELENLMAAANKVCPAERHKNDTIVILKNKPRLAVISN
jgi:integrase